MSMVAGGVLMIATIIYALWFDASVELPGQCPVVLKVLATEFLFLFIMSIWSMELERTS